MFNHSLLRVIHVINYLPWQSNTSLTTLLHLMVVLFLLNKFTDKSNLLFQSFDSMIFRIFTQLCNYHHCLIPDIFIIPKISLYPLVITPHSPSLHALATSNLLSVSINLDLPLPNIL